MNTKQIAFIFPGQGSQQIGMLASWFSNHPVIKDYFAQASNLLGYDLWDIVENGPTTKLNETLNTQLGIFVASTALYKIILSNTKILPTLLAGHSLGECTALTCSNAIYFEQALSLVYQRAHLMQQAFDNHSIGGMAAIVGLTQIDLDEICAEVSNSKQQAFIANYNTASQIVISGHMKAIEYAVISAKKKGASLVKILPVSIPGHCPLMKPVADQFKEYVKNVVFTLPQTSVLSSIDATIYLSVEEIRDKIVKQLYMPVRWFDTIQYIKMTNIKYIVECGPGKILTGLVKRIDPNLTCVAIGNNLEEFLQNVALIN